MHVDAERQREFIEAAARLASDPAGQRSWAANLRDADLEYFADRARQWANAPGADPRAVSALASACEQLFGERNPDSM